MTIEKLKSGSYRVRQMYKGKLYLATVDHKPTTKEAMNLITKKMDQFHERQKVFNTFADACRQYVDSRSNVCSPSTLLGYEKIARSLPEWFMKKDVYDISQIDVQRMVNEYADGHFPKSTRNAHGLVSSVLKMARPEILLNTKLPEKKVDDVYIPSDDEVKAILKAVQGTCCEVPLYLAVFGLRRSEICALSIEDLDGNILSVSKAMVQGPDYSWSIKETPKTAAGNRKVYVTDYVRDLILKQGYIYKGFPGYINQVLKKTEKDLGIPNFNLHKMRHYFASMTHEMGISDADIMRMGGWKTDNVMKTVYRHSMAKSVSEGQQMLMNKIAAMQD